MSMSLFLSLPKNPLKFAKININLSIDFLNKHWRAQVNFLPIFMNQHV